MYRYMYAYISAAMALSCFHAFLFFVSLLFFCIFQASRCGKVFNLLSIYIYIIIIIISGNNLIIINLFVRLLFS